MSKESNEACLSYFWSNRSKYSGRKHGCFRTPPYRLHFHYSGTRTSVEHLTPTALHTLPLNTCIHTVPQPLSSLQPTCAQALCIPQAHPLKTCKLIKHISLRRKRCVSSSKAILRCQTEGSGSPNNQPISAEGSHMTAGITYCALKLLLKAHRTLCSKKLKLKSKFSGRAVHTCKHSTNTSKVSKSELVGWLRG